LECWSLFSQGVFVILSIDTIDGGSAGLILNYAISFTHNVSGFVKSFVQLEKNMTSVEVIKAYIDIKQERETTDSAIVLPENWPSQDFIQFDSYTTQYRADRGLVLQRINVKINPLERVDVVGWTRAGKSSQHLRLLGS
jgi:ABC-type multidrug transport system fused ATPase/permease subunit